MNNIISYYNFLVYNELNFFNKILVCDLIMCNNETFDITFYFSLLLQIFYFLFFTFYFSLYFFNVILKLNNILLFNFKVIKNNNLTLIKDDIKLRLNSNFIDNQMLNYNQIFKISKFLRKYYLINNIIFIEFFLGIFFLFLYLFFTIIKSFELFLFFKIFLFISILLLFFHIFYRIDFIFNDYIVKKDYYNLNILNIFDIFKYEKINNKHNDYNYISYLFFLFIIFVFLLFSSLFFFDFILQDLFIKTWFFYPYEVEFNEEFFFNIKHQEELNSSFNNNILFLNLKNKIYDF